MPKINVTLSTEDLLSTEQARQRLGASRQLIWKMMKRGDLHPIYFSNRPFFLTDEVDILAAKRQREGRGLG